MSLDWRDCENVNRTDVAKEPERGGDGLFVREEEGEWLETGGKRCVCVYVYVYGLYLKKKVPQGPYISYWEQDIAYPLQPIPMGWSDGAPMKLV